MGANYDPIFGRRKKHNNLDQLGKQSMKIKTKNKQQYRQIDRHKHDKTNYDKELNVRRKCYEFAMNLRCLPLCLVERAMNL